MVSLANAWLLGTLSARELFPGCSLFMSSSLATSCSCNFTWPIPVHVHFPGYSLFMSFSLATPCSCPFPWILPVHVLLPGYSLFMASSLSSSCTCLKPLVRSALLRKVYKRRSGTRLYGACACMNVCAAVNYQSDT